MKSAEATATLEVSSEQTDATERTQRSGQSNSRMRRGLEKLGALFTLVTARFVDCTYLPYKNLQAGTPRGTKWYNPMWNLRLQLGN